MSTTSMPTPTIATGAVYSTVTDLARLRGWSTSWPSRVASSHANSCSGTTAGTGCSSVETRGSRISVSANSAIVGVVLLGQHDRARAAGPDLLDAR